MGIDMSQSEITVIELVERYVRQKRNVRTATQTGYRFVLWVLHKYEFGDRIIRDIKVSDAKEWLIKLFDDGYSWNSIASIRGVVRPAFQMAFTEEIIRRNPFDFRLDFLPNNTQKRVALTALHIEHVVTRIWEKYNEEHVVPLPKITPHVFRHTFCTNMANAGMDLKSLQYLMGHSDVSVTLNVYTHTEYGKAREAMAKICSFTDIQMPKVKKQKRKLG